MENLLECPICNSKNLVPYLSTKDYFLSGEDFEIVRCEQCHFLFTNPRPKQSELGKYYKSENYISHSNSSKGLFGTIYQLVRKYTLKNKCKLIENYNKRGSLLDIGCATGHFLHSMKSRGWNVQGIEPDINAADFARNSFNINVFPEEHLNIIADKSIDVITMWHVLEHVADLNTRIAQITRIIKENGTVIIAVPNPKSGDAQKYGKYWAGYDLPRHLYHFSKNNIEQLSNKHGLKLIHSHPMKFDSFYVSLLSEKYLSGKMRWIPAFWTAILSNTKNSKKNGFSSMIYILKVK